MWRQRSSRVDESACVGVTDAVSSNLVAAAGYEGSGSLDMVGSLAVARRSISGTLQAAADS
jgi:hypothetical protein